MPGTNSNDNHLPRGHGTHVAGTIAGANNTGGVVGIAPRTPLLSVKVIDTASGTIGNLICGIEWVTSHAASLNIKVANLSLGARVPSSGRCPSELGFDPAVDFLKPDAALHQAICGSTAAGVTYVVAAGNDATAFDSTANPTVPAVYKQVLTTTAVSDSNGVALPPGAPAVCPPNPAQPDDKAASFSNFARTGEGMEHTIAAPGVCILLEREVRRLHHGRPLGDEHGRPAHHRRGGALHQRGRQQSGVPRRDPGADHHAHAQRRDRVQPRAPELRVRRRPAARSGRDQVLRVPLPHAAADDDELPGELWALDLQGSGTPIASGPAFVTGGITSPAKARVAIDFKPSPSIKCSQANIVVEYQGLPTAWSVDIGDSSTNNGYAGGTPGTTGSCAEVQVLNSTVSAYKHCFPPASAGALPLLPNPNLLSLQDGSLKFVVRDHFLSVGQPYAKPTALDLPQSFHLPDTFGPYPDGYKILTRASTASSTRRRACASARASAGVPTTLQ